MPTDTPTSELAARLRLLSLDLTSEAADRLEALERQCTRHAQMHSKLVEERDAVQARVRELEAHLRVVLSECGTGLTPAAWHATYAARTVLGDDKARHSPEV